MGAMNQRRVLVMLLTGLCSGAGAAAPAMGAQEEDRKDQAKEQEETPADEARRGERTRSSLYETGRVMEVPMRGGAGASGGSEGSGGREGGALETGLGLGAGNEAAVRQYQAAPVQSRRSGVVDPETLAMEASLRFEDLPACRLEIARRAQILPSEVRAGQILLRWSIRADGSVAPLDVVQVTPAHPDLARCVKRVMSGWRFTRPRGGAAAMVQRTYTFPAL